MVVCFSVSITLTRRRSYISERIVFENIAGMPQVFTVDSLQNLCLENLSCNISNWCDYKISREHDGHVDVNDPFRFDLLRE